MSNLLLFFRVVRICKGNNQPKQPGRYLVFLRKEDRWDFAVWGGKKKGWSIGGVPVNPVCWTHPPARAKG